MFVGHFAVALAAKRLEPRLPLSALTAGAFGLDILWPVFVLMGLEVVRVDPGNTRFTPLDFVSYPWSHSLAMSLLWGLLAALAVAAGLKSRRGALIVGCAVVSHWVLDWITHRPDLPLWPGGPLEGLGMWNSIPGTIVVEGSLFAAGITIYLRTSRARDAVGRWAFWSLVLVTGAVWITQPVMAPPPGATAIGVASVVMIALFLAWVIWIERHRLPA